MISRFSSYLAFQYLFIEITLYNLQIHTDQPHTGELFGRVGLNVYIYRNRFFTSKTCISPASNSIKAHYFHQCMCIRKSFFGPLHLRLSRLAGREKYSLIASWPRKYSAKPPRKLRLRLRKIHYCSF